MNIVLICDKERVDFYHNFLTSKQDVYHVYSLDNFKSLKNINLIKMALIDINSIKMLSIACYIKKYFNNIKIVLMSNKIKFYKDLLPLDFLYDRCILINDNDNYKNTLFIENTISDIDKELEDAFKANVDINLDNGTIVVKNKLIELTKTEFKIFSYLFMNCNNTITKLELYNYIYHTNYSEIKRESIRVIDNHMKNIRKKIKYNIIATIHGIGYVLMR